MQKKIISTKKIANMLRPILFKGMVGTILVVLALSTLTIIPQKAHALGNNALLLIGEKCHDLNDINYDFNIADPLGGERCSANDLGSSLAQSWEETVNSKLGCDVGFYQDELTDGTKLWYTQGDAYTTCVKNAQAQLNLIKEQCDGVQKDTEKGDRCAGNDLNLNYALGCDIGLVKTSGSVYRLDNQKISSCQSQIGKAAATRLYHVVEGESVQKAEPAVDTTSLSSVGTGEGGESTDDANCEGGGALGWIICPISELIANFATDMFEDVIAPMLENVPINTQRNGPESGGFQAWQGMRVIANALLIVSLLAVVYAQAKGGD